VRSTKQQARIAGILYLCLLIAPFGLLYVPSQILVLDDATATAQNLRTHAQLLRWGMASELLHQTIAIFLVFALYRLFRPVDEFLAKLVVALGALVSVPIVFANVLNDVAALTLVSGAAWLSAFAQPQLDALAYLFLRLHAKGIAVASIFWGLWLFPFGRLVVRSRFIPAPLGYLLMAAGAGYVISSFTTLVLPQFAAVVGQFTMVLAFGELPIMFWLAIWGARERNGGATPAS
jgi:hypothetical protein